MGILTEMNAYGRFLFGLPGFLQHTTSLEEARATVRQRLDQRESNFLRLMEHGIIGYEKSPYRSLLKLAHVELNDVRTMVRAKGLEETLKKLRDAGVYVSFEESKGRKPIVRDGQVISINPQDFDNPYLKQYYYAESGGTSGVGTRVAVDLDHLAAQVAQYVLVFDAHRVLNLPTLIWRSMLPDPTGLNHLLRSARMGHVAEKWFSPTHSRQFTNSLKNALATNYIIAMGHLCGAPFPRPERLGLDQAAAVARWAVEKLKAHEGCMIHTLVSTALRVSIAARQAGLNLTGVVFVTGGEPTTAAKFREITRSGARLLPFYGFTEGGRVGAGCCRPTDVDDLHFLKDALALIQYPRKLAGVEKPVSAFYFTTLLPSAPRLLLNVESDDYGVVERRSCGCPLEQYGYTEHIRHIRSFSKLAVEGVTLLGSEMVRVLEEVLPGRFGGSPLDYQLVEEEDDSGHTVLSILVSPMCNCAQENEVIEAVVKGLEQHAGDEMIPAIWNQTQRLRVKRMQPILTQRGKMIPLRRLEQTAGY
jgi:phenylacetate-coenzyme A ligase PaaK-like adenylate-forming protein